ncbi:hypothetical protein EPUS_04020 [Endocarpon pusillum Z07020]|uniref:Lysine decarboxylase-like protein n=1 Tax=Endocarpon pusillum (strain Z07020 / HMAS-L-300199) TaxID=1263415 RepID=U1HGN9_ENDPU|nr:uncharacterized protein EPUS_04020 [Endocarpon pusillum Z07020]ERF69315.1 hypothetical protein EPUS_04020 [Endocarpon pusillum Z07020]
MPSEMFLIAIADIDHSSCASGTGNNPAHTESARTLAQSLHQSNISLVYGGGTRGIMGELARTLVSLSGPESVHGIIPRPLIRIDPKYEQNAKQADLNSNSGSKDAERGMSADELQKIDSGEKASLPQKSEYGLTTVVSDMHTRKKAMAQMVIEGGPGSGFVALAGGYGTIEEVMEMVTWNQLGIHKMPIVLVNIDGYWDGLLQWVRNSVKEGYVGESNAGILVEVKSTDEVLDALKEYRVAQGRYNLDWSQG